MVRSISSKKNNNKKQEQFSRLEKQKHDIYCRSSSYVFARKKIIPLKILTSLDFMTQIQLLSNICHNAEGIENSVLLRTMDTTSHPRPPC